MGDNGPMERLTGMDATFLYVETHEAHMHVAMTGIYDVTTMQGGYSFETIKEHIRTRLHLVPPFRRRLSPAPWRRSAGGRVGAQGAAAAGDDPGPAEPTCRCATRRHSRRRGPRA